MTNTPLRRTKIVATLGPATDAPGMLEKIIAAGVNVARLNLSHGAPDDHRARANAVREYLVSKGVDGGRLKAVGRGEDNPLVQCNQKKRSELIACLAPNRRVEVEQITIERKVQ